MRYFIPVLLICLAFLWFPPPQTPEKTLRIGDSAFVVEVARTLPEQRRGLMQRDRLPPGQGMLFVSSEPRLWRMWMKDTLIPLDMVFIDCDGKVQYIAHGTVPGSLEQLTSGEPGCAVAEVNAGEAEKIAIGDTVVWDK